MTEAIRTGVGPLPNSGAPRGQSSGQTKLCKACGRPLDERSATEVAVRRDVLKQLSENQRQVLAQLLHGLTEPQIAEKLHRSRHTVHDHTKTIYSACGVQRRVQLVRYFQGLDPEDLVSGQIPTYLL